MLTIQSYAPAHGLGAALKQQRYSERRYSVSFRGVCVGSWYARVGGDRSRRISTER
jgi:hypothetical protein